MSAAPVERLREPPPFSTTRKLSPRSPVPDNLPWEAAAGPSAAGSVAHGCRGCEIWSRAVPNCQTSPMQTSASVWPEIVRFSPNAP